MWDSRNLIHRIMHFRAHSSYTTCHLGHGPERPQCSEGPHGLEYGDVACAEEGGRKVDDGDGDDDKVEEAPGVGKVFDESFGEELQQGLQQEHYSQHLEELSRHEKKG